MNDSTAQKLAVLLQRHFVLESQLASSLETLNAATANALASPGLRGPSQQDVQTLEPMTKSLHETSVEVASARCILLDRINLQEGKAYASVKEVIADLPTASANALDEMRCDILRRCESAQATLVNNQAVLHYTFDFHRKYLADVFQQECDEQNYRANGQSQDAPRGSLFGRTC